jgi:hypothetical protein
LWNPIEMKEWNKRLTGRSGCASPGAPDIPQCSKPPAVPSGTLLNVSYEVVLESILLHVTGR